MFLVININYIYIHIIWSLSYLSIRSLYLSVWSLYLSVCLNYLSLSLLSVWSLPLLSVWSLSLLTCLVCLISTSYLSASMSVFYIKMKRWYFKNEINSFQQMKNYFFVKLSNIDKKSTGQQFFILDTSRVVQFVGPIEQCFYDLRGGISIEMLHKDKSIFFVICFLRLPLLLTHCMYFMTLD